MAVVESLAALQRPAVEMIHCIIISAEKYVTVLAETNLTGLISKINIIVV